MSRAYRVFKRFVDFLTALVAIVVLLPLMLFIAIVIRIDSRGAVLFGQPRTGKDGKLFRCYKFRTMRTTHEEFDILHAVTQSDDTKITRVGRFLRRAKLDELPQLINVLAGQMSIVGPRPMLPVYAEQYAAWEHAKLSVRPGLTGAAQIHGNARLSIKERDYYDVQYALNAGLFDDIRIVLRTVGVVLRGEEKYLRHVTEDEITEMLRKNDLI